MPAVIRLLIFCAALAGLIPTAAAQKPVRIGYCTSSLNALAAPWAVATKMGWDKAEGVAFNLVPIATGVDCVKFVATGELQYGLPSVEPMAGLVAQGLKARTFYTLYQGTTWAIDVPVNSPIKTIADLKGKKIGVISLSAVGTTIARGLLISAGLDPVNDVTLVNVGEAGRAALFLRRGEIDAVSIFDVAHLQIGMLGIQLRDLPSPILDHAPSLGLIAIDEYLKSHREEAIKIARLHAMGSAFTLANPRAAVEILYEVYPQVLPTGRDREASIATDLALLEKRKQIWLPSLAGISKWGEPNLDSYNRYLKGLSEWGMTPRLVEASEFVTSDLIAGINMFDQKAIEEEARQYKHK